MSPPIRAFPDLEALSRAAADDWIAIARAAVAARGRCAIALSGGSTPKKLFEVLAARGAGAVPWANVDLWWGDERTVPPDHADSNYRMTKQALLDPLAIDPAHVHRIAGEDPDPAAAARTYEQALVAALGTPPLFDLVLLGLGPDAHTASLFPGTTALAAPADRFVVANPVDSPVAKGKTVRITLTAHAINAARAVRFLIAGADKAEALAHVIDGPRDPQRFPAQLVAPRSGDLALLCDTAATARLAGRA